MQVINAIVITGTPATGKSRLAKMLSRRIKNSEVVDVNAYAIDQNLVLGSDKFGSKIIDTKKLEALLNKLVKKSTSVLILEGHLLCDMRIKSARAVVLREHLKTLKKRMEMRGYEKEKIYENIVAEATDYCGVEAARHYEKVGEFLSSDPKLLQKVMRFVAEGKGGENSIDLLSELLELMKLEKNFAL